MKSQRAFEKHPYAFSFLLLILFFVINAVGVILADRAGLPPASYALYTELALVVILVGIVFLLGWWGEIGLRRPQSAAALLLYLPALAVLLGNLTFGIYIQNLPDLVNYFLLACASGFVEELVFRGLMLRAFLPRGEWTAVLVTAFFFGMAHAANALAGSNLLYVVVQIAYALAIGFGFAAMRLAGGMLWPLMIAHALGNFMAFINTDSGQITGGEVTAQVWIISLVYIVLFSGYGLYLMRRKVAPDPQVAETA